MKHLRIHILIQRICCTALRCVSDDTEQDFSDAILPVLPLRGFPQDPFSHHQRHSKPSREMWPVDQFAGSHMLPSRKEKRKKKASNLLCTESYSVRRHIHCVYFVHMPPRNNEKKKRSPSITLQSKRCGSRGRSKSSSRIVPTMTYTPSGKCARCTNFRNEPHL